MSNVDVSIYRLQTNDGGKVTKMSLSDVGHFIEISQVGQMDKETLWIHSDPVSTRYTNVKTEVSQKMQYDIAFFLGFKRYTISFLGFF